MIVGYIINENKGMRAKMVLGLASTDLLQGEQRCKWAGQGGGLYPGGRMLASAPRRSCSAFVDYDTAAVC
jgi:hypothetical protein